MDISQLSDADLLGAIKGSKPLASMSDADLLKAIGKTPDNTSVGGDIAKSAGIGLAKGAIGLAGLPGDLTDLASKGFDYLTGYDTNSSVAPYANAIGSQNIQNKIEGYTGKFYQPKTTAGQYAQTLGEFAPAAIGGPETLASKLATRVIAPAVASETAGQLTQGTPLETPARVAGALLGAGSPAAISRVISPATIAPERQAAIDLLQSKGVPLDAAMQSGNKAMGYLHSELGDALGAGGKATASNEAALKGFTAAALKEGGVINGAVDFKPPTVNANVTDMKNGFNSIADKYTKDNPIQLGTDLQPAVNDIVTNFRDNVGHEPAMINDFMRRLGFRKTPPIPEGLSEKAVAQIKAQLGNSQTAITGAQYQSVSSAVASALRNASSPDLKFALGKFKSALDEAVQGGLAESDQGVWQQLRQRWLNHLILEDAVKSTSMDAAQGLITPAKLETSIQKFTKTGYSRGTSTLEPLARAGNLVLKQLPQSGTAPRAAARAVPGIAGAAIGGHFGLLPGMVAGIIGPAALGRAIYSKPVQAYLRNQKAVGLRQAPLTANLIRGGILGLQSRH